VDNNTLLDKYLDTRISISGTVSKVNKMKKGRAAKVAEVVETFVDELVLPTSPGVR